MADEGEKRIWQGFSLGLGLLIPMAFAVMVGEAGWSVISSLYMKHPQPLSAVSCNRGSWKTSR